MVRQTAEGLGADDVRHVFVNQLQHFRGQEPALAGLIAHGYNVGGHIGHFVDVAGRVKVDALCKGLGGGLPKPFHGLDTGPGYPRAGALFAQVVRLELAVLKAVQQEVHQIRNHSFRSLMLQKLHQMVIGRG